MAGSEVKQRLGSFSNVQTQREGKRRRRGEEDRERQRPLTESSDPIGPRASDAGDAHRRKQWKQTVNDAEKPGHATRTRTKENAKTEKEKQGKQKQAPIRKDGR